MLLCMEGLDLSGKSTLLQTWKAQYPNWEIMKFPTKNGLLSKIIDENIQTGKNTQIDTNRFFIADILSNLNILMEAKGNPEKHIFLDRYLFSTFAYGKDVNSSEILFYLSKFSPDCTVFILKHPAFDTVNLKKGVSRYDLDISLQKECRTRYNYLLNETHYGVYITVDYQYNDITSMYEEMRKKILNTLKEVKI